MSGAPAASIIDLVAGPALRRGALHVARVQVSGVTLQGALAAARGTPADPSIGDGTWSLGPLSGANGRIQAKIVDAQLFFDADVTVPIQQGQVDFNAATVEHVGPDSRMGVSRLGVYVDAPNGRSHLYQFAGTPVTGVEFERPGMLPGPWSGDRGRLQLQAFAEGLLRQLLAGHGLGITQQARQLLGRTTLSGEIRLGDGRVAVPGLQAEFAGRAEGRNAVRITSRSMDDGLTVEVGALLLRQVQCGVGNQVLRCEEVSGAVTMRVFAEGGAWQLAIDVAALTITGIAVVAQEAQGSSAA